MAAIDRAKRPSSTATVKLRIPQQTRELIDSAATAVGKTRTAFMLECARRDAIDVLLDQRFLTLDTEQYEALMRVLDNSPPPNEKAALMRSKVLGHGGRIAGALENP